MPDYLSKPSRILIAEDEPSIQRVYANALDTANDHDPLLDLQNQLFDTNIREEKPQGYNLTIVGNAEAAVTACQEAINEDNPFSVAFLDVRMPPGPDGIWAAAEIRKMDPDIQIVIVTGYSSQDPQQIAEKVPPVDKLLYLSKPCQIKEIRHFAAALTEKWDTERSLKRFNQELEAKVAEKTRDLSKMNRQLGIKVKQLRQAETTLIAAKEKAECANATKSDFISNISHELRTPLTLILNFSEIVLWGELDAEQREHIEIVRESATRLREVIDDILDFSRLENGELKLVTGPFSIIKTIKSVCTENLPRAEEKGLRLSENIDANIPEILVGDEKYLRQVLNKIVGNAIKFTSTGTVDLQVTHEETKDECITLRFTTQDEGIGIPESKLNSIFQPFSQVDPSMKREHDGAGLGLTLAHDLVKMMDGEIKVNSEEGKGSTFSFTAKFNLAGTAIDA